MSCKLYLPLRGEVRRVSIPKQTRFRDVIQLFLSLQNLNDQQEKILQIEFLDDENDWVRINSEDEWKEAINIYFNKLHPNKILRIKGKFYYWDLKIKGTLPVIHKETEFVKTTKSILKDVCTLVDEAFKEVPKVIDELFGQRKVVTQPSTQMYHVNQTPVRPPQMYPVLHPQTQIPVHNPIQHPVTQVPIKPPQKHLKKVPFVITPSQKLANKPLVPLHKQQEKQQEKKQETTEFVVPKFDRISPQERENLTLISEMGFNEDKEKILHLLRKHNNTIQRFLM
jgi:hypothetical protein